MLRRPGEAPLYVKIDGLLILALISGLAVGLAQGLMGWRLWPGLAGLLICYGLWRWAAQRWLLEPVEQLLASLDQAAKRGGGAAARGLPVDRPDELGRIARAFQRLAVAAARDHYEARHLRRTLDHRIAKAIQRSTQQLRQIAMQDPLTGLGNRRFLDDQFEALIESARAAEAELSCVLIDLDRFKEVNDTLGHLAGDELLTLLGELIRACVGPQDIAVRLGGDEFLILLPGAEADQAQQLAQRVRHLFRQQVRTLSAGQLEPDLSIGVAAMRRDGCATGCDLLAQADQYLYRAKRSGRGQVVAASEKP